MGGGVPHDSTGQFPCRFASPKEIPKYLSEASKMIGAVDWSTMNRRPSVMTPERVEQALRMRADNPSIVHIAKVLGVGKSSVHRALNKAAE
jgi:hypothetical protein